jgi:hypothetical protein
MVWVLCHCHYAGKASATPKFPHRERQCGHKLLPLLHLWNAVMPPELDIVIRECLHRLRHWQVPPHWACADWWDEIKAQAEAAACQALLKYDASRRVPLTAYVRCYVMASVRTRYRQEWAYGKHCSCEADEEGDGNTLEECHDLPLPFEYHEMLCYALALLSESDRRLIEQLFWEGYTEAEVAQQLGISHQAVSKHKWVILEHLRAWLDTPENNS